MAENETKTILSLCATTSDRVKDLLIKDGQLIFVHDAGRLALDFKGKRTFYNQIIELSTERERIDLSNAVNGKFYFVIETAVLWRYSQRSGDWLFCFVGSGDRTDHQRPDGDQRSEHDRSGIVCKTCRE